MTMEEMQKMFMFSGGGASPAKEKTAAAPSRTTKPKSRPERESNGASASAGAAAATETLIAAKREDTKTTPPLLAETPGVQYSVAADAALAEKPKMSFAAMFENDRFGSDSESA